MSTHGEFQWSDPFLLEDQLSDDERMVRDSAAAFATRELLPRVEEAYATEKVGGLEDVRLIGTAKHRAGVLSFLVGDIHPHDLGTILDREGIAIRTGHHCAQPVMQFFHVPATARASFALYNTRDEIDRLVKGIEKVKEVFA